MPVYRFGPFRLDTERYRLTRGDAEVQTPPRQLDLLACLAAEPSRLITRDELFDRLWAGVAVTDNESAARPDNEDWPSGHREGDQAGDDDIREAGQNR